MASSPLLWVSLIEGETSFGDKGTGKKVFIKPISGECILVFHTDSPEFRQRYQVQTANVADALFFHKKSGSGPTLLVVELKGSDYETAASQIETVVQRVRADLHKFNCQAKWRALIVASSHAPDSHKHEKLQERLSKHGVTLRIKSGCKGGNPVDIRQFIQ